MAEEGIRVNAVRPGIIRTEIHASGGQPGRAERLAEAVLVKRPGEAEEIAHAIAGCAPTTPVTRARLDVSGGR